MKRYFEVLKGNGSEVNYVDAGSPLSDIRCLISDLSKKGIKEIHYIDPVDDWLKQRIESACGKNKVNAKCYSSPQFLNTEDQLTEFFKDKKRFFQTDFYIDQRKKRNILLENEKPLGGKWSFDADNRKKYPAKKTPPAVVLPKQDAYDVEAVHYTVKHFLDNPGTLNEGLRYPTSHLTAERWLDEFLEQRFSEFGIYEDAIVRKESFLHHSVITPMLNVGLLTPDQVISKTLDYASEHDIPMNSLEGFIRQIMGWREYIRAVYVFKGRLERTKNFWGFTRKLPAGFWDGTTGIVPIDETIRKVLKTGYCHHIERLMILGNFMLLCEFDPDEVYRWFMEMFIDAYDWVMVPNVYGMSQFADGGLMSTKPYISGSNYVLKMSDYKKESWTEIWDALFWRFLLKHRSYFKSNIRMVMLLSTFDKRPEEEKRRIVEKAERFLDGL